MVLLVSLLLVLVLVAGGGGDPCSFFNSANADHNLIMHDQYAIY